MKLKNADIYERNPLKHELANSGVAQVTRKEDEDLHAYERTLRFELENFVCDGEYARGLEDLLRSFIDRLRVGEQPTPAWLSGFYGAGKSHLAKMLAALWQNYRFADGATAMSLAVHLPASIRDLLVELHNESRKYGGLHVASGLLSSVGSGQALGTVLGVVFKSRGLPPQVHLGRFVLWLKEQKYYDAVRKTVEAAGKNTFESAVYNMVANREIREALAKCDPGLGGEDGVREALRDFAKKTEVDETSFRMDMERVLRLDNGEIPLTLLVLDEVQQFIGTDTERTLQIQVVAELCASTFKGRVQLLATGQAAMGSTPELQKLKGRFPLNVHLTDNDVEGVIRQTVLQKSIKHRPDLEAVLSAASGEISRHLSGSNIAPNAKDADVLVADYPILPTRRRFFEAVLRAVDATGVVSQLRNQLRIAYDAAKATGSLPVGNVIGGDFVFDELQASDQFQRICPTELSNKIRALAGSADADEQLMGRLMKLIFVINRLPHEGHGDSGVRATADALADLLVTDLTADSASLRARVPELLKRLETEHHLVMVLSENGHEVYRENTKESQNWYADYQQAENELRGSSARLGTTRSDLLKGKVREALAKLRVAQGQLSLPRDHDINFEGTLPATADSKLTIWVQDGWNTTAKAVEKAAQASGVDSPTLFVFVPEKSKSDLNDAVIAMRAAEQTLQKRGTPTSPEGQDAQKMMERRLATAKETVARILAEAVADAVVHSGGGAVIEGDDLFAKVQKGIADSLPRLYSRFNVADQKEWGRAESKARSGDTDALKVIGHTGDVNTHPVCKELLDYYGTTGKKGAEAQDKYEAAPYGWPRDAIQAATLVLLANGFLKARDASNNFLTAKQIERNQFTKTTFQCEHVQVTVKDKMAVMSALKTVGIQCSPGEELSKAALLGPKLHEMRMRAGGEAPRPVLPPKSLIEDIEKASGNAQLVAIAARHKEIVDTYAAWSETARQIEAKSGPWQTLQDLLQFAQPLPQAAEWNSARDAIVEQRALLLSPDPVNAVRVKVEAALREALNGAANEYATEYAAEMETLQSSSDWQALTEAQRKEVIAAGDAPASYAVDTSSVDAILRELRQCDLKRWRDRIEALPNRFEKMRQRAAKLLEPTVVTVFLPRRVLRSEKEVRQWLAEVEKQLLDDVKKNPVQV
jgi:hypothetical protein